MVPRIIRWSLSARTLVLVVSAGVLALGVIQLTNARVDALPEFGPPVVEVQTEALGLSAPEVEQLITVPLEQDLLNGVAWLATIRSESLPGLSSIEMTFQAGTDLFRARQVVQERLSQAAGLPNVSSPPQMLQPRSSTSRVMMIGLTSRHLSPIQMSVLARWTIRPRLLGVPGVANVSIWGQRERQLQVLVEPERLLRFGISLQQVIETTANALWASPLTFVEANTPGTGGFIETGNQRLAIQHLQPISTAAGLARVPLEDRNGAPLPLSDVARVVEDHQPLIGDAVLPNGPGLILVVEKSPGANTIEVTNGVDSALDALRPGLSGIRIDPGIYRPAAYVETSRHNVTVAVQIGLILVALALGALFLDWHAAVISLGTLLLSFMAAVVVLQVRGATINAMVAAGLVAALAIVIDDSIVDMEGVARRLRQLRMNGHSESVSLTRIILEVASETRTAAIYATLIVGAAAVPAFFLRGEAGAFFPPFVLSFLLAIAASMFVALVVTPALAIALLSRAPLRPRGSSAARWLRRNYERTLKRAIAAPGMMSLTVGVVLLAGALTVPFVTATALPQFADADVLVDLRATPGISLPEMSRITQQLAERVRSVEGVDRVAAHVGRAISSDQLVGVESGELWVGLDPAADRPATLASIKHVTEGAQGIRANLLTYPGGRITAVLAQSSAPVVVRLFGQDLRVLNEKAREVAVALSRIDGVVKPRVERQVEESTVQVRVDIAAASAFGVKPGDVRRAAATMLAGIGVGSLFDQQKVFDVVVWGAPETRTSMASVGNLLIDTPGGGHVRLGRIADVRLASTPPVIRHEDISRSLDVSAAVRGRSVGAVLDDVRSELRGIRFPLEYHAQIVGDYAARQADHRRFLAVAIAAGIGVLLLLQAAFRSWRLATAVLVSLPVALVGGALALLAGDRLLTLGSAAGFFAVFAITVRGCVASIRHFQHLERDEGVAPGEVLILRGSRQRLVPILMTAAVAGVALLPLFVSVGVAGQELLHPMAIVVIGGLLSSVLFNLYVVPVLYGRFGSRQAPDIFQTPITQPVTTRPESELVRGGGSAGWRDRREDS